MRGGIACTRAVVRGDDVVVRTHAAIAALIEEAALPARVARAGAGRLPLAGLRRVGAAPAPGRPGALPRGRRARRHRRHRRDGGRARGAGGRRGERVRGGDRERDGAQRPRAAAQPGAGHGAPARGHPDLRARRRRWSSPRPTGAALLAALCSSFGPLPDMTITRVGLRRGRRRDRRPAQLHPGRDRPARRAGRPSARANRPLVLETNLDDVTGEQLGYAVAAALEAGAFDAWVSPVTMKKGRPGHVLHVLADADARRRAARRDPAGRPGPWACVPPPSSAGPWPAQHGPGHRRRDHRPHEGHRRTGQAGVRRRRRSSPPRRAPRCTRSPAGPRRPGGPAGAPRRTRTDHRPDGERRCSTTTRR